MNKKTVIRWFPVVVVVLVLVLLRWTYNLTADDSPLENANKKAELFLKVLAAVVGTIWAAYQFYIGGMTSWMNNISLETSVLPYRDDLCLLVIHVRSTNPRDTFFEFDEKNATFRLDIRLIPDGCDVRTLFDEEDGEHVERVDLLKGSDGYEMLPSASVDDMRSIVLPRGKIASLTAELRIKRKWRNGDDFISASSIVRLEPDLPKKGAAKEVGPAISVS